MPLQARGDLMRVAVAAIVLIGCSFACAHGKSDQTICPEYRAQRCDVLVAGANHYTLMFDPYAREVARAIDRFVSAPSSRSRW